jgi:hypothetical protein
MRELGVSEAVVRPFGANPGTGRSSPKAVDEIAEEFA